MSFYLHKNRILIPLAVILVFCDLWFLGIQRIVGQSKIPIAQSYPISSSAIADTTQPTNRALSPDEWELYQIVDRLVRANNLQPLRWQLEIVPENAGYASTAQWCQIVIDDKLLDALNRNRDAVAFVIAHEMAHNIHQHTTALIVFLQKEENELARRMLSAKTPQERLQLKNNALQQIQTFLHHQELEADTTALEYILRADYQSQGSLLALEILRYFYPETFTSDTHPSLTVRLDALKKHQSQIAPIQLQQERQRQLALHSPLSYQTVPEKNALIIFRRDKDWH